jgi:hypothetical protein
MDVIKTHIARVEQRDERPVGGSGITEILVSVRGNTLEIALAKMPSTLTKIGC